MPPPAATQAAARLWTARVARCSFHWLFLMQSVASKMRRSNAYALLPSHCNPVPSYILTHNNLVGYIWRPGWPIVGTATSHPSPRETIVQEFLTSCEEWGGALSCWKYIRPHLFKIQRHILKKSGQFLLQKFEVRLSCKATFQDERTNQLIVQNCTPHIDTKT